LLTNYCLHENRFPWPTDAKIVSGMDLFGFNSTRTYSLNSNSWNFRTACNNNAFLMDIFRSSKIWCDSDMRALNAIRLHLQVATLSAIVTADGLTIDTNFFQAIPSTTRKSILNWIRQPTISDDQRQLWQKALKLLLNTHSRLVKPLWTWHLEPNKQWTHYYNESTDSLLSNIYSAHPGEQFRTYPHGKDMLPTDHFLTLIHILMTVMSHI
jgi:hypothetical protein